MNLSSLSGKPVPCDLLVVAAHPDDAELFCGGTMAKSVAAGKRVVVVDVTCGELSSNGTPQSRLKEREEATRILGLADRVQLGRPDGGLSGDLELVPCLVRALRAFAPRVLIGPPPSCRHPDHQALHDALKQAHFFCGVKKFMLETTFIPRPLQLMMVEVPNEEPDLLVDISKFWEVRLKSLLAYKSQFDLTAGQTPTFINSGFLEALERRYRDAGQRIGVAYAEPFLCTQPPVIGLPTDLNP